MPQAYCTCRVYIQGRKETKPGRRRTPYEAKDKGLWIISKEYPETFCKDNKEDRAQTQMQGMRTYYPVQEYAFEEGRGTESIG